MSDRHGYGSVAMSVIFLSTLLTSCSREKGVGNAAMEFSIPSSYPAEQWQDRQTGLAWSLSLLGATLPEGSLPRVFARANSGNLLFDPAAAGFNEQALQVMNVILDALKESEEFRMNHSVDIGRFFMLTVYSSYHYYAITGAESTLAAFRNKYGTPGDFQFVANNSTVSNGERLITFHVDPDISRMYFMAEEGSGSVAAGTFMPLGAEVISIMPNGQPRFALYDENGRLTAAADSSRSSAGKPGKCMWCHESNIQPLFSVHTPVAGYLTLQEFSAFVDTARQYLEHYRNQHQGEIAFDQLQDHTFSEWLYEAFMEPSAYRLSQEWGMDEGDVKQMLNGLPLHANPEFPFISDLYNRKDVEPLAPVMSLPVPESVREQSGYEPDLFGIRK